jgi:truncated hemoglobin YjbI
MENVTKRTALALCLTASAALIGCGASSSTPDAGATTTDAGTVTTDAGMQQQSLYTKYGGAPTIAKVVDDAVTGLLGDCQEAPYFTNNLGKPGHDSAARLKSCLRLQFTAALGGPATYPGKNDQGDMCQDMATVHADIGITGPVFDQFITDLAGVLKADGVSDADIATIAPALTGLKPQIVSPTPTNYASCAGQMTLYTKYGGAPTVSKLVDDAVTGLLGDCKEAPYFTNNLGKSGHDSVARLKSCLRLQFTTLLGGPGNYPGMNDEGDMCQDMKTIHADIGIPGPIFDQFITDLAGVLKADGVSDADIQMLAPQLVGLKTPIVSSTPMTYNNCQ